MKAITGRVTIRHASSRFVLGYLIYLYLWSLAEPSAARLSECLSTSLKIIRSWPLLSSQKMAGYHCIYNPWLVWLMHVMNLQLHLVQTKSVRILTKYSETYHKTLSEFEADHITMLCCEHAALIINVSRNWSSTSAKPWHHDMGSWLTEAILSMCDQTLVLCSIDKYYTHKKKR